MKTYEAIAARLEGLCRLQGLSHYQLAVRANLSPSTVKNLFNGSSRNPGVTTLRLICQGLNVTLDEFFRDPLFLDLDDEN